MMTEPERLQFAATIMLVLRLIDRGLQCAIHFPLCEAPVVRVDGLDMVETTALSDGHYEIWDAIDPGNPAPLRCYQSLAEAVTFLSQGGGRA